MAKLKTEAEPLKGWQEIARFLGSPHRSPNDGPRLVCQSLVKVGAYLLRRRSLIVGWGASRLANPCRSRPKLATSAPN